MALKDVFFKLVPVEDGETAENLTAIDSTEEGGNQIELPIIQNQVQYQQATQPGVTVAQAGKPEDAHGESSVDVMEWVRGEISERDEQIKALNAKLDRLIKYGQAQPASDDQQQSAVLTPDAPSDYVPLRELDFVTRDGKF